MKVSDLLTDDAVLAEIGRRIAARRIDLQLTQADVAEQAGIAKRTLERMEAGHSSQLSSLVRVLRVLDVMPGLEGLIPETGPRPMALLKGEGKVRQRASGKRANKPGKRASSQTVGELTGQSGTRTPGRVAEKPSGKTWEWGDNE